jgi:uncharacterized protein YndB with AHSA1/START domain
MCNHAVAMTSIERSIDLDAPADDVWRAITDEYLLGDWLATDVEIDAHPGGALRCRAEDGEERIGTVELVEEGERIAFSWQREGMEPSRVELRLTELERGTRLDVVETGLREPAAPEASLRWSKRFESLRLAMASLAYA